MKKIYVVGIGPGNQEKLTLQAKEILLQCDVIAGYTVYIDLVKEMLKDDFSEKEISYISTGMTKETERCRMALEEAKKGKTTAMICSGDAGVYGMAGIIFELSVDYKEVEIEIVPGITAALSGAAVLGAPIGHDFSIISLSDRLTPWEKIEKRIACAAMSDMCICIYNPSSKARRDYLCRACDIILQYQPEDLICGYVKNIGRDGEHYGIVTLAELRNTEVDMFTTVFIGNTGTRIIKDRMVTPRGYNGMG